VRLLEIRYEYVHSWLCAALLQNPKQDSTVLVTRLNKALQGTLELIQAYNDKHFIVRVLTSKSAKEDFEQATLEITRCVTDLTLEVTISLKDMKRDALDDGIEPPFLFRSLFVISMDCRGGPARAD